MAIIYITLAWVFGIWLAERLGASPTLHWLALALAVPSVWIAVFRPQYRLYFTIICVLGLGILRFNLTQPDFNSPNHITYYNARDNVTLVGIVRDEPTHGESYLNVKLDVEKATWVNQTRSVEGKVLIQLPQLTEVEYGDVIEVSGNLYPPPRLDTFSYQEHLARQGVYGQMQTAEIRILEHDQANPLRARLIDFKGRVRDRIQNHLPEPQSGLLVGILLGDDSGLDKRVKEAFNNTGTSHIIAISGFNMTLIAGLVSGFLVRIFKRRRWTPVILSIGVLVVYTLLVGANASVVRASIMSSMLIVATTSWRRTYVPASLAFTTLVMSLQNPHVLWDIGFQLSLAAVLGMALFTQPLSHPFRGVLEHHMGKKWGGILADWLNEPLIVTTAAQLTTLPIILHYFGTISPVFIAANFLIIPAQGYVLILGGLALLLPFLFAAEWVLLSYTLAIVRGLADTLPSLPLSIPQEIMLTALVLGMLWVILKATRPLWFEERQAMGIAKPIFSIAPFFLALALVGMVGQRLTQAPDDRLHVVFLDMGHSQSVLIRTPDGAVFLIDGGRYPTRLLTALGDYLPPNQQQIDTLFITSQEPHDIEALVEVADRYDIKALIPIVPDGRREPAYQILLDKAETVIPAEVGYRIQTGDGVLIEILSADPLVLRLTYQEAVFLLPADLESKQEAPFIADRASIQATVLVAAKHATQDTNSATWIESVNPQVVILQTDPASRSDETDNGVVERFGNRNLYRTDKHGTIEIITDGQSLEIKTEK